MLSCGHQTSSTQLVGVLLFMTETWIGAYLFCDVQGTFSMDLNTPSIDQTFYGNPHQLSMRDFQSGPTIMRTASLCPDNMACAPFSLSGRFDYDEIFLIGA